MVLIQSVLKEISNNFSNGNTHPLLIQYLSYFDYGSPIEGIVYMLFIKFPESYKWKFINGYLEIKKI